MANPEADNYAGRPTIVCLCGSTRFYAAFQEANYRETMAGKIVLSVGFYPHAQVEAHGEERGCTPEQKLALDELHKKKIDLADEVLILNVGGYIGSSTRSELQHAVKKGKRIRFLVPDKSTVVERPRDPKMSMACSSANHSACRTAAGAPLFADTEERQILTVCECPCHGSALCFDGVCTNPQFEEFGSGDCKTCGALFSAHARAPFLKPDATRPLYYGGADNPHEVKKCLAVWGLVQNAYRWNAVKYIARAGRKDPAQEIKDLEKAREYLAWEIERLKGVK